MDSPISDGRRLISECAEPESVHDILCEPGVITLPSMQFGPIPAVSVSVMQSAGPLLTNHARDTLLTTSRSHRRGNHFFTRSKDCAIIVEVGQAHFSFRAPAFHHRKAFVSPESA
jgi:hypothetical protein